MNSKALAPASGLAWWSADALIIFGITVPILPMVIGMTGLWVGRELVRNRAKKMTKRESVFVNVGLALLTFLVITGKLVVSQPLEVGWALVWGIGIGMNGPVLFEIFQRFTYAIATSTFRPPPEPPSTR
ncbi:MAG: hypothetical protein V4696_03750 [Pseudomonadota bacterium]